MEKHEGPYSESRVSWPGIPHYGDDHGGRDWCGNVVENFNYPINLMFSCSMPVFEGNLEKVLQETLRGVTR